MDEPRRQSSDAPKDDASSRRPISIRRIAMSKAESDLEQRARRVGSAAGTMVALLRDAKHKLNESDLWKSTNPLSDLRTTAKGKAQELRHTAEFRAQEWRRAALERMAEFRPQAKPGDEQVHGQSKNERGYALPVVAAAGIVGFLLGAGLKAWKSRHND